MQASVQEQGWWLASDGNWYPPDPTATTMPSGASAVGAAPGNRPQVLGRIVASFGAIGVIVLAAAAVTVVLGVAFGRGGGPCAAVDLERVREITLVAEQTVEAVDDRTCVIEGTIGERDPDDRYGRPAITILISTHEDLSIERQADIAEEFRRTNVTGVDEANETWTFPDEAWVRNGDLWVHVTIDAENLVNHDTDAALVADSVVTPR